MLLKNKVPAGRTRRVTRTVQLNVSFLTSRYRRRGIDRGVARAGE